MKKKAKRKVKKRKTRKRKNRIYYFCVNMKLCSYKRYYNKKLNLLFNRIKKFKKSIILF